MAAPLRIEIYSDFLCPWCYVASTRVEWLAADPRVEVERLPYELHPTIPVDGRLVADVYGRGERERAERALARFADLADAEGLPWRTPTRVPNTRFVLGVDEWLRVHAPDAHVRFHAAAFSALWAEDRDLTDRATIAELVASAGGPVDEALAGATGAEAAERLEAHRRAATERGVGGTPAFVIGELVIPGVQDTALFERILDRMVDRAGS